VSLTCHDRLLAVLQGSQSRSAPTAHVSLDSALADRTNASAVSRGSGTATSQLQHSGKHHVHKQPSLRGCDALEGHSTDENSANDSHLPEAQQIEFKPLRPFASTLLCEADQQADRKDAGTICGPLGQQEQGQIQAALPVCEPHVQDEKIACSTQDSEVLPTAGCDSKPDTVGVHSVCGKPKVVSAPSPGRRMFAAQVTLTRPAMPVSPTSACP